MSGQATKAPEPANSITFYGTENVTYKGRMDNIPDKSFTHASLDGTDSVYYIYPEVNECGSGVPSILHILDSMEKTALVVKPPRSCKGFSKKGILLFATFKYGGPSQNFTDSGLITSVFPVGSSGGVSSLRVFEGTWELLTQNGENVSIGGETTFWPGFCGDIRDYNDKLCELRRVQ